MHPLIRTLLSPILLLQVLCVSSAMAEIVLHHRYDNDPDAADGFAVVTVVDASPNLLDGTPSGGPVYSAETPPGQSGLSILLERSDTEFYRVANDPALDFGPGSAITIEAWVKLDSLGSTNPAQRQVLVFKKDGAIADFATNYGFLINSSHSYGSVGANPVGSPSASGQNMVFVVGDGTGFSAVHSTIEVSDTDWHYVAVRFDDATDTVRFTIDGTHEDVTGVTRGFGANALDLLIGAHTTGSGLIDSGFNGLIAELRISRGFLSDGELLFAEAGGSTLRITDFEVAPPNSISISFDSTLGHEYDIKAGTDLESFLSIGTVTATSASTTFTRAGVALLDREFFVVEDLGPPPPLFTEDFEGGGGEFVSVNHATGSEWEHGTPSSEGPGGSVTSGAGGSTACWGTDLGSPGYHAAGTDVSLRSPVIDLTGLTSATLSFAQARDIADGDTAVVNIIDDTTDTVIASAIHDSSLDPDISISPWETVGPIPLPAIALGQPVRLEFRFAGSGGGANNYLGWYIDNVKITNP